MNNRRSFIVGIKATKLSAKEVVFLRKYKPTHRYSKKLPVVQNKLLAFIFHSVYTSSQHKADLVLDRFEVN